MSSFSSTWRSVLAIAAVTVQEGVRTRLVWLVGTVLLVGVMLATFVGTLAVTESQQVQSGILGAYLRLAGVLITCLFVLNAQVREFNDKGLDLVLSLPIPRGGYFLGKLLGFFLIALAIALLFFLVLLFYAPLASVGLWSLSFLLELFIVVTLSLLCLYTFDQVPSAFTMVLAVYLLSRAIASLQLVGQGPIMPQSALYVWFINRFLDGLAFFLPALDRFTQAEWLVYGSGSLADLGFVVGQGLIYLLLLSAAALIDLYRRNF
ncbi:MAG: hypothetical protein H7835_12630 [Magnetococcus sp. XQGC-1]